MHELSIAQNIAKIVHLEYKKGNYKIEITKINFSAGKMNAIIPESLQMNFNVVKDSYDEMKTAELIINEKEVIIKCNKCNIEVEIDEPIFTCKNCGSSDIRVVQGKDMYVENFEI